MSVIGEGINNKKILVPLASVSAVLLFVFMLLSVGEILS